jgi:hypothetical protein
MGAWTTDATTAGRPLTEERLAEYVPPPGQKFIPVITYRNPEAQGNLFGRTIGRHIIRVTCWLGRLTTPAPYDLMGAEVSKEAAERHCEDSNWSVIFLPVGATFPKERIRWKWNYSPRRWFNWNRERAESPTLYRVFDAEKMASVERRAERLIEKCKQV